MKIQLVEQLMDNLESNIDKQIESVWITEAKQRRDEIINGMVEIIPGDEALAKVRQIIES